MSAPISDEHWRFRAACTDEDPELFFDTHPATVMAALAVCRGCPVAAQCLTDELEQEGDVASKYRYGVRGGMTPLDRTRLVRAGRETG